MDYSILVNRDNPIDENYVPSNLVVYPEYNGPKIDSNHKTLVEEVALNAFYEMQSIALRETGYCFIVDSAYRSYKYQQKILMYNLELNGDEAYNYVALPGTSEHQTGLAIDIALNVNGEYTDQFDDTFPQIKWLFANAYRFGFILRYPKGMENITGYKYECWHFRYVGKDIALYMHNNNISTLEEYHELIRNK